MSQQPDPRIEELFQGQGKTMKIGAVADIFDTTPQTIRRLIAAGALTAYRPGRDYLFLTEDVRDLFYTSRVDPETLAEAHEAHHAEGKKPTKED